MASELLGLILFKWFFGSQKKGVLVVFHRRFLEATLSIPPALGGPPCTDRPIWKIRSPESQHVSFTRRHKLSPVLSAPTRESAWVGFFRRRLCLFLITPYRCSSIEKLCEINKIFVLSSEMRFLVSL